jgi:hypothetical protein
MPKRTPKKKTTVQFIVSKDKAPRVPLKPGMRLDVVSTVLLGPDLKRAKALGARLCGGSGTCMALVDLGSDVINPAPRTRRTGRGAR